MECPVVDVFVDFWEPIVQAAFGIDGHYTVPVTDLLRFVCILLTEQDYLLARVLDCETRPECMCYFCDEESDDEESSFTFARD